MFLKSILINLLLVASVYCGIFRNKRSSNNKCVVKLSQDNELKPLLILRDKNSNSHTFVMEEEIEIEMNKSVWLSCAPFKLQQFPDKQLVEATCKTEQTFEIDGIQMEYSDLKCEQGVYQHYVHPLDGCKANEEYKSVKSVQESIYDPINNITYVIGEICYDDVKENTIFQHVKLSYPNQNLLPLSFQNGQFIVPSYRPSINAMSKRFSEYIENLSKVVLISSSDSNAIRDFVSPLSDLTSGRFIAKTNYKLEESFDDYMGAFIEDDINYWWNVVKKDERAVGAVSSDVNDDNEVAYYKYDEMQNNIFGMPTLKSDQNLVK